MTLMITRITVNANTVNNLDTCITLQVFLLTLVLHYTKYTVKISYDRGIAVEAK